MGISEYQEFSESNDIRSQILRSLGLRPQILRSEDVGISGLRSPDLRFENKGGSYKSSNADVFEHENINSDRFGTWGVRSLNSIHGFYGDMVSEIIST